jgi:DNA mismatch repair protein MutS
MQTQDTPIILQYKNIKQQHQDKLLLFHLGDFFEMFYEDAQLVSKTLGLTLTYRKNGEEQIFMCGFPLANKDFYFSKLIENGFKLAICEQTETPCESKKRGASIINRSVTAIYTAGTYVDTNNSNNNYILSLNIQNNKLYCFYVDLSTEDFFFEHLYIDDLSDLLFRINPKEILLFENIKVDLGNFEEIATNLHITTPNIEDYFSSDINDFLVLSLDEEKNALKILFQYLHNTYNIPPTKSPIIGVNSRETTLDQYTIQNLDLFHKDISLYNLLNKNITPMGKRKLKELIVKPLTQVEDINLRLEAVHYFFNHFLLKNNIFYRITNCLQQIGDIQKTIFLLKKGKLDINLIHIFLISLEKAEEIIQILKEETNIPKLFITKIFAYKFMNNYKELLLVFEKTNNFFDKNFLTKIYNQYNLEDLLNKMYNHQEEVKKIIPNAKLTNNSIIGYFFEISNKDSHLLDKSPIIIIVKQTLLHNIRFTTKTLVELENDLIFMENKQLEIRTNIIQNFIEKIFEEQENIYDLIEIIKYVDVFRSFGVVSVENNFHRPMLIPKEEQKFSFKNARHVVLEQLSNNFIKNDLQMIEKKFVFITGPNMGGKSTFMRTTALIILMAQIGCFVGAEEVYLSPMNILFVRIGFNDDAKNGHSTFYKEMVESAKILKYCESSQDNIMIIIDEMCRGTSYEEGICLSKAIIKFLFKKDIFVLISSHYLKLAQYLKQEFPHKINTLCTQYIYNDNKLKFLYKLKEGIADASFSIQVASMAGLPVEIIQDASNIMKDNYNEIIDNVL